MKKNKIINIVLDSIIVLLLVILIFMLIINSGKDDVADFVDYVNYDTKELKDEYVLEDLKIYDSIIMYNSTMGTNIVVKVENISDINYYNVSGLTAKIYNSEREEIAVLYSGMSAVIKPNLDAEYNFSTDRNIYDDIYMIEYVPIYDVVS